METGKLGNINFESVILKSWKKYCKRKYFTLLCDAEA